MEPAVGIFIAFILFALLIRVIAGSLDGERVEAYIQGQGGELLDKSWDPLGPGWFGEKDSRIYQIVYRDKFGNVHKAHVKTSAFSGVYLTNDEILEPAANHATSETPEEESLAAENARLKARIEELENQQRRTED